MSKYCANCGRELPDEAMYCPDCGKKFVPRYRADNTDCDDENSSDYEFNGPFGPSSKKFEGPFGPHSNRGSFDSNPSSGNGSPGSSNKGSLGSSNNGDAGSSNNRAPGSSNNSSNGTSLPFNLENIGCLKLGLIILVAFLLIIVVGNIMTGNNSNDLDSSVLADNANDLYNENLKLDSRDIEGKGSIDNNEPFNISIDGSVFLSGKGEVQLIDSNHSYNIESEGFNITEYETYYVDVDEDEWYVLDIFKCKFDNLSQSEVYATDLSDGDPIIIYGAKGDYYGYGILIPNSSDNSTYRNIDFLESIFFGNE